MQLPNIVVEIPLRGKYARGRVAYVHITDACRVLEHKWYLSNRGYAIAKIQGKTCSMHRFVFGDVPPGLEIDHRDRQRLNNNRSNLRAVTRTENARNRGVWTRKIDV